MQNCLYRIRDVNNMSTDIVNSLHTFDIDGIPIGKVRPAVVQLLCETAPDVFVVKGNNGNFSGNGNDILTLHDRIARTCEARTGAVDAVMRRLCEDGVVRGWRDERYPLAATFYDPPVLLVERAAVPLLGALEYGVHVNGIVAPSSSSSSSSSQQQQKQPQEDGTEQPRMWMARRSADKSKYPGMLDHVVAGGQPAGRSLWENAIKECEEEAGIPANMARDGLVPIGAVSYASHSPRSDTITRAVLFNYDLYLPRDFVPRPVDGEVEEFFQWGVPDLVASLAPDYPDPLKPNCYLPVIDWLIRRGHLSPDTPGYLDVVRELRSGELQ